MTRMAKTTGISFLEKQLLINWEKIGTRISANIHMYTWLCVHIHNTLIYYARAGVCI